MATQNVYEAAKLARDLAWDGNFPVNPIAIAAGLVIIRGTEHNEQRLPIEMIGKSLGELSGYAKFVDDEEGPRFVCAYNHSEAPVRQRFTQAHELGHVLLDHVSESRTLLRDATFNAQAGNWEEIDANAFAAELIMPAEYVEHQVTKTTDISEIARYFGVSPTAIHFRLKNLGIL